MTQYDVKYACGHEGRSKPVRNLEDSYYTPGYESMKCPKCVIAEISQGLPELYGSEEEVARAVSIRREFVDNVKTKLSMFSCPTSDLVEAGNALIDSSNSKSLTSAKWWLSNRHELWKIRRLELEKLMAKQQEMYERMNMPGKVLFEVQIIELTLAIHDGILFDMELDDGGWTPRGTPRESLEDALAFAREEAASDKLKIFLESGSDTVAASLSRNVYQIVSFMRDDDGDCLSCTYEGKIEDYEEIEWQYIDVLDFHPEVRKAWDTAVKWHHSFYPEDAFGENWRDLDYVKVE